MWVCQAVFSAGIRICVLSACVVKATPVWNAGGRASHQRRNGVGQCRHRQRGNRLQHRRNSDQQLFFFVDDSTCPQGSPGLAHDDVPVRETGEPTRSDQLWHADTLPTYATDRDISYRPTAPPPPPRLALSILPPLPPSNQTDQGLSSAESFCHSQ